MASLLERALEHHQRGRLGEAESIYREVLQRQPCNPDALHLLGVLRFQLGQPVEALAAIEAAIRLNARVAPFHNNLGIILGKLGQAERAAASFRKALALDPGYAEAHNNLGDLLQGESRLNEAMACYREALRLNPRYAEAHNNLGNALMEAGRPEEAVRHLRHALEIRPRWAEARNNLGNAYLKLAFLEEAVASYREALAFDPGCLAAHSALLHCLNCDPTARPEAVFAEHRRWAERHALPLAGAMAPHLNEPEPERRLRIGYLSPDFRSHSVASFFEPVLAAHDRSKFKIHCYSKTVQPDAVTRRLAGLADQWRDIWRLSEDSAAGLIREDRIDILVDLAGHTAGHGLAVMARKPAPVQVTWLGYPNTTGLETIDYRITDAMADPPGATEHLHSEELVRLPRSFLCYQPPEDAPEVGELPARRNRFVTFGSFSSLLKVTPQVLAAWATILQAAPGSRLVLKSHPLAHARARERVLGALAAGGVGPERVDLLGAAPGRTEHLALYGGLDVALDTFPYHGTTTTCEALWMGVPVVVLEGKTHAARVGSSVLATVGLRDWVAASWEEYVELAARRARNLDELEALRRSLRERMRSSALMDASGFAARLEAAYRQMWRRWCAAGPPDQR